jgi:hypothetical protein
MRYKSGLALLLVALTGCFGSSKGMAPTTGGAYTLKLTAFQERTEGGWPKDSRDQVYTNNRTLKFTGNCSGFSNSKAFINSVEVNQTFPCPQSGQYEWILNLTQDGEYSVEFKSLDSTGSAGEFMPKLSLKVVLDTVPPASPTISTPNVTPYASVQNSIVIAGGASLDTIQLLTSDASGVLRFSASSGNFDYTVTLNWGETKTYSITAVDLAGNQSSSRSVEINFHSGSSLALFETSGTGLSSGIQGTSNARILSNVSTSALQTAANSYLSSEGTTSLFSGPVNYTNQY